MKTTIDSTTKTLQTINTVNRTARSLTVLLVLLTLAVPFSVQAARERFVLALDDTHILGHYGDPTTLPLKKIFQQQYPRVDITDLELCKIVLVAKSKLGWGTARLRVGERYTESYMVAGRPADFHDRRNITFDRIPLLNPSYHSRGPWQIELQGNIKVREVVLEVEDNRWRRHHYNGRPQFRDRHHYR